ncbi:DNA-binding NarL/FixJ family response regulator [Catalinimonas alkaloidigena]|uniref:response regulator transcription factor n=1 Tax=Catalinimonas alkaloidigena TaxID=1075417 RepID=UPI0024067AAA|nr:response regulator transcription factor [Catalinimonas alkaloidigena]MDF9799044.1 DNA-binding NarL/FixJ family response regulator [Catalinimonas alkaloidigena]
MEETRETIKATLADDHGVVRSGIKSLLESEGDIEVISEAENGQEAFKQVKQLSPDLAILDVRMPEMTGLEVARMIKKSGFTTKILILSMHDDEDYILQAVESGASGYLLKGSSKEEFLKAVRTVHRGEKYFSADVSRIFIDSYLNTKNPKASAPQSTVVNYELTKREKQILTMLVDGIGNKEIAERLNKSIRTIETHRFNIMKKLGVSNVVELLKKVEDDKGLKDFLAQTEG